MINEILEVLTMTTKDLGKHKVGDLFVSTSIPSDTGRPETAVEHPDYNGGVMIIVEEYDTVSNAKSGHTKWIKLMSANKLPDELIDISGSPIKRVMEELYPKQTARNSINKRKAP